MFLFFKNKVRDAVNFGYDKLFFNEIGGPEKGRFGQVGQMVDG